MQAGAALVGGGSLRRTVWAWQLLAGLCFLLVAWLLDRLVRAPRGVPDRPGDAAADPADPAAAAPIADAVPVGAARSRAAVLWTLNPLLVGQLVLGAHLDLLAVAAVTGALALALARPVLAGVLLGIAVGVKAPYALVGWPCAGVAVLPRRRALAWPPRRPGALLVLVPAHCWSGPDTRHAARQPVRHPGHPWRLAVDQLTRCSGRRRPPAGRPLALVLAALLCLPLARGDWPWARSLPDMGGPGLPGASRRDPGRGSLGGPIGDGAAWAVLGIAPGAHRPYVLPGTTRCSGSRWLLVRTTAAPPEPGLRGLETALLFRLGVLVPPASLAGW